MHIIKEKLKKKIRNCDFTKCLVVVCNKCCTKYCHKYYIRHSFMTPVEDILCTVKAQILLIHLLILLSPCHLLLNIFNKKA